MTRKGDLQKFIDKEFEGRYDLAANEMVSLFANKYKIPGSAGTWDFYQDLYKVWSMELAEERRKIRFWDKWEKEQKKISWG